MVRLEPLHRRSGSRRHIKDFTSAAKQFWNFRDELSIDDELILYGVRIIVPRQARKDVIQQLHTAHQGIKHTKRRARQTVYWPGINNDITNTVASCDKCQKHLPLQQQEPMISKLTPSRVFEDVSAHYFSCSGRDFLIYVHRLSGWPVIYGSRSPCSIPV